MPSIHSIVSTLCAVRFQSTVGTRKSGSSRVFSAISESAAASSRKSISIATERRHRRRRLRPAAAAALPATRFRPCARHKRNRRGRPEARARCRAAGLSPQRLSARRPRRFPPRCTCAIEAAATGGPKLAKASLSASQGGDHGCLRRALWERRQPVLQAFQIARHHHPDHVGPGGEKLSELDISWPQPRQRGGEPPEPSLAPGRATTRAMASLRAPGTARAGFNHANTPSRANTKPARARRMDG